MENLHASMVNVGWDCRELFMGWLLKVGLTEYAAKIWVCNKFLCLPREFGLHFMDSSMVSSKRRGVMVI
jgi:hypothetical protein